MSTVETIQRPTGHHWGKVIATIQGFEIVRYRWKIVVYCECGNGIVGEFYKRKQDRYGRQKNWWLDSCADCDRNVPMADIKGNLKKYLGDAGVTPRNDSIENIRPSDFVVGDLKRLKYKQQFQEWGDRSAWSCCVCGSRYEEKGSIVKHHVDYIRADRILVCKTCHGRIHSEDTKDSKYLQFLPWIDKASYKRLMWKMGIHDYRGGVDK